MAVFFQRIATLILKSLRGELSEDERKELFEWINDSPLNEKLYAELTDEDSLRTALSEFYESDVTVWNKILKGIEEEPVAPVRRLRPWRYIAAASVTILVAAGAFWWFTNNASKGSIVKTPVTIEDIKAPTGNNSTLTLSDGSVIYLDSTGNGILAQQGNSSVIKKEGVIQYNISDAASNNAVPVMNTLRAGHGGQQKLYLPDGSYILLNAESSVTYPTVFAGNERKIQVTGEAWYEIKSIPAKDGNGKMPFIVEILSSTGESRGQVEVLGTQFSINAYDDEAVVKTTLVEGSVRMHKNDESVKIKPGQQVQLGANGKLNVIDDADIDAATAFVRNEFKYQGADIETILRDAARWYPISYSFPKGKPVEKYYGTIPRSASLPVLLKIFIESDLKFKLEGNKLIVTP